MAKKKGQEAKLRLIGNGGGDNGNAEVDVLQCRELEAGIFEHRGDPDVVVIGLRNLLDGESYIWLTLPQLSDLLQLLMLVAAQLATQHEVPESTRVELLRLTAKLAYVATCSEPQERVTL